MTTLRENPPLLLPSQASVESFVVAFLRNRLAARPQSTILVPGEEITPWLYEWWEGDPHPPGQLVSANAEQSADDCVSLIVSAKPATGRGVQDVSKRTKCVEAILLPGAGREWITAKIGLIQLEIGNGPGTALLVPGTADDLGHRLTPAALERLDYATIRACEGGVRVVVLSGWGGPGRKEPEAWQLAKVWAGPSVPLVTDTAARTSAENVVCGAGLLVPVSDIDSVIIVSSWSNALRLHLLALFAFRRSKISVRSHVMWGRVHATSWRPGLAGLLRIRHHLRIAREFLKYGSTDSRSQL